MFRSRTSLEDIIGILDDEDPDLNVAYGDDPDDQKRIRDGE